MILGKAKQAKPRVLKLNLVIHKLPSVGPNQFCVLSHLGCTHAARTMAIENPRVSSLTVWIVFYLVNDFLFKYILKIVNRF